MTESLLPMSAVALRQRLDNADVAVKMVDLPAILSDWLAPFGGLEGKEILDFGCGFGELAAGIALQYRPARVIGVDIVPKFDACQPLLETVTGRAGIPPTLGFQKIAPNEDLGEGEYDVIYSWSAMEHVPRSKVRATIERLKGALREGGLLFIQVSPLYFSAEGSHLWALGYNSWEHLIKGPNEILQDLRERFRDDTQKADKVWSMYLELNRLTAREILDILTSTGFEIIRQQADFTDLSVPESLHNTYSHDVLTQEQLVILARKSNTSQSEKKAFPLAYICKDL